MEFKGYAIEKVITRGVSPRIASCQKTGHDTVDYSLSLEQHRVYVQELTSHHLRHFSLAASPGLPDCVFCEDTAVIVDWDLALITNPGAISRRAEILETRECLTAMMTVTMMPEDAYLDGGDVLRYQDTFFVGLSGRTNQKGLAFLAATVAEKGFKVVGLKVLAGLHLKSSLSLANETTLIYHEAFAGDLKEFENVGLTCLATSEFYGANVLYLGEHRVLVSEKAPKTGLMLKTRGLDVIHININEFHKADGALTCPSLRIPRRGYWCS